MDKEYAMKKGIELMNNSKIAMVGTVGDDGFPYIKAMLSVTNDGLKNVWFSTNTSSKRVNQIIKNKNTSVYFVDDERYMGLMLLGEMEIQQDEESRKKLWSDGSKRYYPLGIDDPDYTVLKFTARRGNYYEGLQNVSFDID